MHAGEVATGSGEDPEGDNGAASGPRRAQDEGSTEDRDRAPAKRKEAEFEGSPLSEDVEGEQSTGSEVHRHRTPGALSVEGGSVVPDLMHVYENLKRSSTPHDPQSSPQQQGPSKSQQQVTTQQQEPPTISLDEQTALLVDGDSPTSAADLAVPSGAAPPPTWPGYTIFDFSIPTIPSAAYAVMMEGATASASTATGQLRVQPAGAAPPQGTAQAEAEQPPPKPPAPPKASSDNPSPAPGSGRNLRKRPSRDESASVGSASSSGDRKGGGGSQSYDGESSAGRHNHSGSHHSKRRKSTKETDGRWSKRFTWPEDLHRDFVSAIFDVGLKHSSPSTIMEYMPPHEKINSERIKSHLQKYRLHRAKSKEEFMTSYETSLKKMNESGLEHIQALAGGEVAAHLTYSTLNAPDDDPATAATSSRNDSSFPPRADAPTSSSAASSSDSRRRPSGSSPTPNPPKEGTLILPRLTEEEKQSAIGTSMGYLMGLFFSLTQQLMAQRAAAAEAARAREAARAQAAAAAAAAAALQKNPPVTAVYDGASSVDASSVTSAAAGQGGPGATMSAAAAAAFAAASGVTGPSTLSNLEENSMMKREMQSQMAFQNKMRALKQEELKKWRRANGGGEGSSNPSADHPYHHSQSYEYSQYPYPHGHHSSDHSPYAHAPQHHGTDHGDPSHHYGGDFAPDPSNQQQQHHHHPHEVPYPQAASGEYHPSHRPYAEGSESNAQQQQQNQQQHASNPRADRQRGLSFGNVADDLWNAELGDDEQLFEFLLNN